METTFATEILLILQLLVALLLGMAIGTERSISHKTAGMRTYGLVALGACLFIIISEIVASTYLGMGANVAPLRVTASIVTGIGFIGAGAILFRDHHLTGLTSAAGLWVAAGIGVAVGFGLYLVAVTTTVLTLATFTILWKLEERVRHLNDDDRENDNK